VISLHREDGDFPYRLEKTYPTDGSMGTGSWQDVEDGRTYSFDLDVTPPDPTSCSLQGKLTMMF
jgi:hypothetical protein